MDLQLFILEFCSVNKSAAPDRYMSDLQVTDSIPTTSMLNMLSKFSVNSCSI